MRAFVLALIAASVLAQSTESQPKFLAADFHSSPQGVRNAFFRGMRAQNGFYSGQFITMLTMIATAYGFNENEVVGGPIWLEMDKFDLTAKLPADSTRESQREMLRALLEERFKLTVHKDVQPMPALALSVAKKHQLKPAEGPGENQCRFVPPSQPPGGGRGGDLAVTFFMPTFSYDCKAITMAKFTEEIRNMLDNNDKPVIDRTGLEGAWNFSFKFSPNFRGMGTPPPETISITSALEKLGFKFEPVKAPVPVLVVDRVNETPTPNPADTAELIKQAPLPGEFEVADIKPSDPSRPGSRTNTRNGRMTMEGVTIKSLIVRGWNLTPEMIFNVPKFAEQDRYDIIAKLPTGQNFDPFSENPPLQALLKDRFKLAVHMEDRPVDAYTLVAVKPKLQKANPATRTRFREGPGPDGKDPRNGNPVLSRLVTAQNMTMKQFAERLSQIAGGYVRSPLPVIDATGLDGSYDFTLSFSPAGAVNGGGRGGRGGDLPATPTGGIADASDPNGAISLFEALEKQLGLKLEMHKRPGPCLIVDHVEQKPTEN